MGEAADRHRLEGLEPDNLLGFLALLGLLRALETAHPDWRPRANWDLDQPPLRPVLTLRQAVTPQAICEAAAEGVATLAAHHDFAGRADLNHSREEGRAALEQARQAGGYRADLFAALLSDAAIKETKDQVEATPLCLLFGQGHQHFLDRLAAVPNQPAPPPRGRGKTAVTLTAADCLYEALFQTWERPDPTFDLRWDPEADVRYALMFGDPSDGKNKGGTQHGANRLATIGLSCLTAAPSQRGIQVRLSVPGGTWDRGFRFAWPIWRDPVSLTGVVALLAHPGLGEAEVMQRLGVDHMRQTRRLSVGKFMNFTPGLMVFQKDDAAA